MKKTLRDTAVMRRIRGSQFMRAVFKPVMDIKWERRYQKYLQSEDSQKIKMLKNTHLGERCFIIGNGPSLRAEDLDRLIGEYTFAANRIYEIFDKTKWRPTVYTVSDHNFLREEYEKPCGVPSEIKLISYVPEIKHIHTEDFGENTIRIFAGYRKFIVNPGSDKSAFVQEDISRGFSNGYTVTFINIQTAIYMGFKEIYLLGVDFDYPVVFGENGKKKREHEGPAYFNGKSYGTSVLMYEPVKHAYFVSRVYCEQHGITIRNATRGGKLEVFERVDFDGLF